MKTLEKTNLRVKIPINKKVITCINNKSVFIFLLFSCFSISQTGLVTNKVMVVSAKEEASQIGIEIMKKGGNAFDAMIATELALAVCYPYAGNISGGGFMVYRLNNGETGALDYREKAPINATKDMYLDANENIIPKLSVNGALSIGVPGTVYGIFAVHEKFGKLSIEEIMNPVIQLAKKGVVVTEKDLKQIEKNREDILKISGDDTLFAKNYKVGDTIKYNALAETLTKIMKNGKDEFYKGETANKMVAFIQKNGGIITLDDLHKYEAKWREPIRFKYKELDIISMSPPSSGGITLAQIMTMLTNYKVSKYKHNSEKYIQLLVEAERRAYADRNFYIGDPDFVNININQLLNKKYLRNRIKKFSWNKATKSTDVSHGNIATSESNETTHYSIIDSDGNAVSVTTTLNGAYGSKLYSDELGFFFNNQMDDLVPNPIHLIPTD